METINEYLPYALIVFVFAIAALIKKHVLSKYDEKTNAIIIVSLISFCLGFLSSSFEMMFVEKSALIKVLFVFFVLFIAYTLFKNIKLIASKK